METITQITYDLSSARVPRAQRRARTIAILLRIVFGLALLLAIFQGAR